LDNYSPRRDAENAERERLNRQDAKKDTEDAKSAKKGAKGGDLDTEGTQKGVAVNIGASSPEPDRDLLRASVSPW